MPVQEFRVPLVAYFDVQGVPVFVLLDSIIVVASSLTSPLLRSNLLRGGQLQIYFKLAPEASF